MYFIALFHRIHITIEYIKNNTILTINKSYKYNFQLYRNATQILASVIQALLLNKPPPQMDPFSNAIPNHAMRHAAP